MLPPSGSCWDGPVSWRGSGERLLRGMGQSPWGSDQQLRLSVFILEAFPFVPMDPVYPSGHSLNHRLSPSNYQHPIYVPPTLDTALYGAFRVCEARGSRKSGPWHSMLRAHESTMPRASMFSKGLQNIWILGERKSYWLANIKGKLQSNHKCFKKYRWNSICWLNGTQFIQLYLNPVPWEHILIHLLWHRVMGSLKQIILRAQRGLKQFCPADLKRPPSFPHPHFMDETLEGEGTEWGPSGEELGPKPRFPELWSSTFHDT